MCLLLVLHRVHRDYPLIVAANRDERYDRESLPPEILPAAAPGAPDILAPRDATHGGTWIGVNSRGLFIGVTNRPPGSPDPTLRSRGLLALDALGHDGPAAVERFLDAHLATTPYNPFNLIWSDGRTAGVIHVDGTIRKEALPPGVHILSNHDDVNRIFVTEILRHFDPIAAAQSLDPSGFISHLQGICRDHEVRTPKDHAICKHLGERGTVSSTILMLARRDPFDGVFLHAPGPPCQTDYFDGSTCLGRLGAASRESAPPSPRKG